MTLLKTALQRASQAATARPSFDDRGSRAGSPADPGDDVITTRTHRRSLLRRFYPGRDERILAVVEGITPLPNQTAAVRPRRRTRRLR